MKRAILLASGLLALLVPSVVSAEVSVPSVFASHMVLQRDQPVTIWGWGAQDEAVTVAFAGQTVTGKANDKGAWKVSLAKMPANAKSQTMTIKGTNTLEFTDVLVGDVWLGSGQSNMEWSLAQAGNPQETIAAAKHPNIRLYHVKKVQAKEPAKDVTLERGWAECTPETAKNFSAVLYHFGVRLEKDLNVPIGLINSSWGGSRIEPWTPGEMGGGGMYNAMIAPLQPLAMRGILWYQGESNMSEGMKYFERKDKLISLWRKTFGQELPFYFVQIAPYSGYNPTLPLNATTKGLKVEGGKTRVPLASLTRLEYKDGKLANRFENEVKNDAQTKWVPVDVVIEKDEAVISSAQPNLRYTVDLLPELWEAQAACLKIPGTGMAGTTDLVDNFGDIHPKNKFDVGNRLALWALASTYGKKDVVYTGPLYQSMKVDGGKVRLSFAHTGGGLQSRDGKPLSEFEIAGEDGRFVPAEAVIEGKEVVVQARGVEKPTQVRFGWRKIANPNLSNKEGLPASPFRTKDWKGATGE